MLDFFGHVGYGFIALGLWQLTRKRRIGWLFRLIGEVIWVMIGWQMGMSSIYLWGLGFMLLDIIGFSKWETD